MSLATAPQTSPAPVHLRRELLISLLLAGTLVATASVGLALSLDLGAAYLAGAAAAFAAVAWNAVRGLGDHAHRRWGDANRVTLGRGVLVALVAGALAIPAPGTVALWLFSVMAVTALLLDGVDGWIARRQDVTSDYGARFDMGLDTLFTLALALLLWRWGEVGPWALLIGLLRYLFVGAGWLWPALTAPLPFSQRRRVACAVSVGVLAVGLTPIVAPPLTGLAVGAALGLLLFSFAVDTVWLIRRGSARTRNETQA